MARGARRRARSLRRHPRASPRSRVRPPRPWDRPQLARRSQGAIKRPRHWPAPRGQSRPAAKVPRSTASPTRGVRPRSRGALHRRGRERRNSADPGGAAGAFCRWRPLPVAWGIVPARAGGGAGIRRIAAGGGNGRPFGSGQRTGSAFRVRCLHAGVRRGRGSDGPARRSGCRKRGRTVGRSRGGSRRGWGRGRCHWDRSGDGSGRD